MFKNELHTIIQRGILVQVTDLLEARPELTLGQMGNEVVADLIQAGTGAEIEESEVCFFLARFLFG